MSVQILCYAWLEKPLMGLFLMGHTHGLTQTLLHHELLVHNKYYTTNINFVSIPYNGLFSRSFIFEEHDIYENKTLQKSCVWIPVTKSMKIKALKFIH